MWEAELVDDIMLSCRLQIIWIDEFSEIPEVLCDMYTAVRGVDKPDWDYLAHYRWGDSYDC